MHLPAIDYQVKRTPEPPAMVRVVPRPDVTWNRWVFKAPPLVINPPKIDTRAMAAAVRRGSRAA